MKNEKICINKGMGLVALVIISLVMIAFFMGNLANKSTSTNTRASIDTSDSQEQQMINNIKNTVVSSNKRAQTIPVFEYHGDNYSMYPGYDMSPTSFERQMKWLSDNGYHAVTGEELEGFLTGTFNLPPKSIILTTDSGNLSQADIPRMEKVLDKYGMHFFTFIWTQQMNTDESVLCKNDACWETFRKIAHSKSYTIGMHTESHKDFAKEVTYEEALADFKQSIKDIEDNIGVRVYSMSWPFESCPSYAERLFKETGMKYAFGGNVKPILENYITFSDPEKMRYCLPRILPPGTNDVSGRPNGKTIKEIMDLYNKSADILTSPTKTQNDSTTRPTGFLINPTSSQNEEEKYEEVQY